MQELPYRTEDKPTTNSKTKEGFFNFITVLYIKGINVCTFVFRILFGYFVVTALINLPMFIILLLLPSDVIFLQILLNVVGLAIFGVALSEENEYQSQKHSSYSIITNYLKNYIDTGSWELTKFNKE